jgi:hypothetical protein
MRGNQSRSETKTEINEVHVHSQATEPEAIAADIKKALERTTTSSTAPF